MNDLLTLLVGGIPEAIYFSLFIVFAKGLKEKRILFTVLMVLQYVLLTRVFVLDIYFQIIYTFMTFVILKSLYKEKAQITDIFLFISSVIILTIFTIPFLLLNTLISSLYVVCIISKICLFIFLYLIRGKIRPLYIKFFKHWNRDYVNKRKIKSLTLKNISIIVFNLMFVLISTILILIKCGILG